MGPRVLINGIWYKYIYGVTNLDLTEGNAPTLLVRIKEDFGAWEVTRTQ
jgi:hypothetical protein